MSTLSGDTPRSDKAAKAKERKACSTYCKTPPPPTGDYCEELKNKLVHAKTCLAMREAFGNKWYNDGDAGHEVENGNWRKRIMNLEDQLRDSCPKQCGELGIK